MSPNTSLKLDALDHAIMKCLLKDARSSVAQIAKTLKMNESTIRHRLNRLLENDVVDFALITNPLRFGFQVWSMLELQVEQSKIRTVAERIAKEPEVHLVGIMSGSYDVYAGAVFRSNEDLVDFITHRLSRIPGIIRTSNSTMLEILKRTVSFGFPDEVMGATSSPLPIRKRRPAAKAKRK
ncbi:MAG TPA: Lrp/AsnC family transcriptional regulator [Hyphomicrobiaceae bacterium]